MTILTITGIEAAINECTRSIPQVGHSLSPDARVLADIYGLMIFEKSEEIDFAAHVEHGTFGEKHIEAIEKFYNMTGKAGAT